MHSTPCFARACALVLVLAVPAARAAEQDTVAIRLAAESAVRALAAAPDEATRVFIVADPLDPRLRLPACTLPLTAAAVDDGGLRARTVVAVRCTGARGWSLYVPVRVESDLPVLVALRPLPRDATPHIEDFRPERRRVPGLAAQFVADAAGLAGRRLRRPLAAGEVLAVEALAVAPVVHRGEQVMLLARSGTMEIRVAAVALADGRPDEHIRVQNLASQRVIEGVVRGAGLVEVPL